MNGKKTLAAVLAVAVVLVALVLAANPRLRCQATFGTWVPARVETLSPDNPDDNYTPVSGLTPARCSY